MGFKKQLEKAMNAYVDKCVLPSSYRVLCRFLEKGKSPTYEEYLDCVLSDMRHEEKEK